MTRNAGALARGHFFPFSPAGESHHACRSAVKSNRTLKETRSSCVEGALYPYLHVFGSPTWSVDLPPPPVANHAAKRTLPLAAAGDADHRSPRRRASVGSREPATATALETLHSLGMSSLELGEAEAQLPDPAVPVFNVATALVTECLWKGQVGCAGMRMKAAQVWLLKSGGILLVSCCVLGGVRESERVGSRFWNDVSQDDAGTTVTPYVRCPRGPAAVGFAVGFERTGPGRGEIPIQRPACRFFASSPPRYWCFRIPQSWALRLCGSDQVTSKFHDAI